MLIEFPFTNKNRTANSTASFIVCIYSQFDSRSSTLTTYDTPSISSTRKLQIAPNQRGHKAFQCSALFHGQLHSRFHCLVGKQIIYIIRAESLRLVDPIPPPPQIKKNCVPLSHEKKQRVFCFALDIRFFSLDPCI